MSSLVEGQYLKGLSERRVKEGDKIPSLISRPVSLACLASTSCPLTKSPSRAVLKSGYRKAMSGPGNAKL